MRHEVVNLQRYIVKENWPGYPIGILLCFGGVNQNLIIGSMKRYGCSEDSCLKEWPRWEGGSKTALGHTAVFPCHRVALWFKHKDPSPITIAHECFHAAYGALPGLGIKLSDDTEEVYAYAIDNLMRLVLDTVAKREAMAA